jgi:hypothetical protein
MKCIEIIAMPPGEAPEEIRKSWIGVIIPLPINAQAEQEKTGYGVLSGPRSWFLALFPFLHKTRFKWRVYRVSGAEAVSALAKRDEPAADWWRKNTPHLLKRHWQLLFPADVCRIVER